MAAKTKIDHISVLECQERYGSIQRLVRLARVIDLADTDYAILMEALEAAGIPAAGSKLDADEDQNLVLTERNMRLVEKGIVDVELVYEFLLNDGQSFDDPAAGLVVGRIEAVLNQVESNLDGSGNLISVSHTYPSDDPDYPDETRTQGGTITYFQPQKTFTMKGIKNTPYPWLIADSIIGTVNSIPWSGQAARMWLCSAVSWQLYDIGNSGASTNRYLFTFEFQLNPDGWDPTVVYIDERTGKPPPNLVANTGYKTIQKLSGVDFESVLGVRVQGG